MGRIHVMRRLNNEKGFMATVLMNTKESDVYMGALCKGQGDHASDLTSIGINTGGSASVLDDSSTTKTRKKYCWEELTRIYHILNGCPRLDNQPPVPQLTCESTRFLWKTTEGLLASSSRATYEFSKQQLHGYHLRNYF